MMRSVWAFGAMLSLDSMASAQGGGYDESKMEYIDNGVIKLGVNKGLGGAITYIADSQTEKNIVNNYDWGRQIQMSFFAYPIPYSENGKDPAAHWEHIGWNPIQAGDDYGNGSAIVDFQKSDTTLYVKCIPMQWPLDNVPGECTYECWIELDGNTAQVRARLVNNRSDQNQYNARHQELPAVYSNGEFYRLMTYRGDQPFTGDAVVRIPKKTGGGFPWDYWLATENWAALVDDNDWGLGIHKPDNYFFIGGFAGQEGQGGTFDSPTGYIAPLHTEILDHDIVYEYTYTLIVGDLTEIRDYAVVQGQGMGLPDWTFENDRQHWRYNAVGSTGTDAGWPINDYIQLDLGKNQLWATSPPRLWQAEEAPVLYINAAFSTSQSKSRVAWTNYESDSYDPSFDGNVIAFDIIGDGEFRTYAIDLASVENYAGAMSYLGFQPSPSPEEGGWVKVKRIWFGADQRHLDSFSGKMVGNDLALQVGGGPGRSFAVEATSDLSAQPTVWTDVGSVRLDEEGEGLFVEPGASLPRFYRLKEASGADDPVAGGPVANAGFETPVQATFTYGPLTDGWTFNSSSGLQASGWQAGAAPEGAQTAFLQGGSSSIEQSLSLEAGDYEVVFWIADRTSDGGMQTVEVRFDGAPVGTFSPANGSFEEVRTNSFTVASPGDYTLEFAGAGSGDVTAFVDAVSITAK
ncbi:hypothetical protein [Pelagicoccus mobilis]|uniref:Uncharacterized protein n=1 Tax=Pelagicoccus mobilis TaxID=415221 RepID=A0A934S6X6_9BACT|nr:hypothetical protein [Pelagicoccus mobilis]MBK1880053.1 hypothetical protein [Pelagicoccus mobilis]